jgi:hypothetical protein
MMGGLMQMIQGMLSKGAGSMLSSGVGSGLDQFGANANGRIMPQGGQAGNSSFSTGMMHGMSGIGSGGVKHAMNTKQVDHQLGLSALQQYQDMSRPDYSGMSQFMQFANTAKPAQSRVQAMQPNPYVQALLSGMRGGR